MFRLLIAFVACFAIVSNTNAADPEPRYKGKPLGYWVERLQKAETDAELGAAATAVRSFGADAKPAIPILMEMLLDHSEDYRRQISSILSGLGSNARFAVPALVKLLKEKKTRDPFEVIRILEEYGPEAHEAVPILIESLKDIKVRGHAFAALCAIGPSAKPAIPALKSTLSELQAPPANEWEYFSRLNHAVPSTEYLVFKLSGIGADAVPFLLELLESDNWRIRKNSIEALGKIGPTASAAAPRLQGLLKDKDDSVRLVAATSLWNIKKDSAAIETLVQLAGVDEPRAGYICSVGESAVTTLGEIGPGAKSALPNLRNLLEKAKAVEKRTIGNRIDSIERAIAAIEGKAIYGPAGR